MENESKLQETIEALRDQVTQLFADRRVADKVHELEANVASLDQKYRQFTWKMKFLGTIASVSLSVLLALAGFFGLHYTYNDIRSKLETRIHDEIKKGLIREGSIFYDNLMAGYILRENSQYRAATDKLMKCFTEGHHYDTAVLVPLLWSLYQADDWERAAIVVRMLKKDDIAYQQIPDSSVYVLIGSIEVQAGPEHPDWLDDGFKTLNWIKSRVAADEQSLLRQIHLNVWVYHLQRKNFSAAQQAIDALKGLDETYGSWRGVKGWRFFRDYLQQEPSLEPRIKDMWDQLPVT